MGKRNDFEGDRVMHNLRTAGYAAMLAIVGLLLYVLVASSSPAEPIPDSYFDIYVLRWDHSTRSYTIPVADADVWCGTDDAGGFDLYLTTDHLGFAGARIPMGDGTFLHSNWQCQVTGGGWPYEIMGWQPIAVIDDLGGDEWITIHLDAWGSWVNMPIALNGGLPGVPVGIGSAACVPSSACDGQ